MAIVLVIGGDDRVREHFASALRNRGAMVNTALDPLTGIVSARLSPPDIVVTDHSVAESSATVLLRHCGDEGRPAPVMLFAGLTPSSMCSPGESLLHLTLERALAVLASHSPQSATAGAAVAMASQALPRKLSSAGERALRYIRDRYMRAGLTLADVACDARVSRCHLTRILRRETGKGFLDHLHKARTAAAIDLLATSRKSIKEIAFDVGYRGTRELDRQFRRRFGRTPSAVRLRLAVLDTDASIIGDR